jgi:hypothetical protein
MASTLARLLPVLAVVSAVVFVVAVFDATGGDDEAVC